MKIAMFVFNTGNGDRRLHRQATLLADQGHLVRVYCFLDPPLPAREDRGGYEIHRLDQRKPVARFFDDQIMARLKPKKKATAAERPEEEVVPPLSRPLTRPCPEPPPRDLPAQATPAERDYLAYVKRINLVWAEAATRWKPDVCQAHDADALEAAAETAARCGAKLVYDSHEIWVDQPFIRSQEAVDHWSALEAKYAPKADAVITVSEPFARVLKERYQLNSVTPVHNCQNLIPPVTRGRDSLRPRFGGRPVALYQGVLGPDRGLEELVCSAAHQDQVGIAVRGFGERRAALEELAQAYEHVEILPPVPSEKIVAHAAEGTFGVIPFLPTCLNHYWNTPNKLFEFMMAGLPIASADLPDLRKFIHGHQIGLLFDPYCFEDVARALVELSEHPELEAMGERAYRACAERYHWEEESKALLEVYQALSVSPI